MVVNTLQSRGRYRVEAELANPKPKAEGGGRKAEGGGRRAEGGGIGLGSEENSTGTPSYQTTGGCVLTPEEARNPKQNALNPWRAVKPAHAYACLSTAV